SAVVLFDLLIVRLLVIGNVVVILLNLMIWHSNCWDKRSRTVVVPHFRRCFSIPYIICTICTVKQLT
ncbi:hypothetical protein D917_02661, partial [Trichinella nativa]